MQHYLKTDPDQFYAVRRGLKTFEFRFDDRNFAVGDVLELQETRYSAGQMKAQRLPLEYTGAIAVVGVSHVLRGPAYGIPQGYVIMSIRPTW